MVRCADHILVEAGQQTDRFARRQLARFASVAGEHPGSRTFNLDRTCFIAQQADPLFCRADTPTTPPTRKIVVGCGTVGSQKTAGNFRLRHLRIYRWTQCTPYLREPGVRTREPHALAQTRSKTQAASECSWLENGAPTAFVELRVYLLRQLLPGHHSPVQRGGDGFCQLVEFLLGDPEILLPQRGLQ